MKLKIAIPASVKAVMLCRGALHDAAAVIMVDRIVK
jgi:hypothetical protein